MSIARNLSVISKSFFSYSRVSKTWPKKSHLTSVNLLARYNSTANPLPKTEEVKVTFVKASGERIEANGKVGENLLDIVQNNEIHLEGFGACEGTLCCSTCHLILTKKDFDRLPDKPSDEEQDMLDLAFDLTDTSRLGCQIYMTKELDGLEVKLPSEINCVDS